MPDTDEKTERKFNNQEHYDLLKKCSDKKDMTEWNNFVGTLGGDEILLEHAILGGAHLKHANLNGAHLERAVLFDAHLEHATLTYFTCNGLTQILNCHLDKQTDFRGVTLDNIQWSPGLKQLAEYNNRRLNWIDWYKKQRRWWQWPEVPIVWFFWFCSDYGRSTQRILGTFFGLSMLFAIYMTSVQKY